MRFPYLASWLASLLTRRNDTPVLPNLEPGSWSITLVGGSSNTGYVWHDVFSTYSRTPQTTVHCTYTRGPTTGAAGELVCDESVGNVVTSNSTTFRYRWGGDLGVTNMMVWQTVEVSVDGVKRSVNVTGSGEVEYVCGFGFNKLGCEGSGSIRADKEVWAME